MMYKPKIGETIYVIFENSISKEKVYMLGESSFIHQNSLNPFRRDVYREPLDYWDYGATWFTSLNEAKGKLKSINNYKGVIRKIEDDYWEIMER